jgi:peptidoglycan/LPS O-acetylase OafA/YrhL
VVVPPKLDWLLNKWSFGAGRIIDFSAVAIVAVRLRSFLRPLSIRPLVMLGQASLPVFCVHLLCVFAALTILGEHSILDGWLAAAVVGASLSALLLTAKIAANRREQTQRKRPAGPNIQSPPRKTYDERFAPAA